MIKKKWSSPKGKVKTHSQGRKITRVSSNKTDVIKEIQMINTSLKNRGIKREAYLSTVTKAYVKKRTRKGYSVADKNYAICMRNIR